MQGKENGTERPDRTRKIPSKNAEEGSSTEGQGAPGLPLREVKDRQLAVSPNPTGIPSGSIGDEGKDRPGCVPVCAIRKKVSLPTCHPAT